MKAIFHRPMTFVSLSAFILIAGCAGTPAAPITVKVAVPVPCQVQIPPKPVFPADTLTGDEDIWTLGVTMWADRKARQAYELQVETALAGCVK